MCKIHSAPSGSDLFSDARPFDTVCWASQRDRLRRREIEGIRNSLYHLFALRDQVS